MKKYRLILHPGAEKDILSAYHWGMRTWGKERADTWVRELHTIIRERLMTQPHSCSVAPESEDLGVTVRQLVVNRYRVLFTVEKRNFFVLHLRGAYAGYSDK